MIRVVVVGGGGGGGGGGFFAVCCLVGYFVGWLVGSFLRWLVQSAIHFVCLFSCFRADLLFIFFSLELTLIRRVILVWP